VAVPNRECVAHRARSESFESLGNGDGVVVDFWRATDGLDHVVLDVYRDGTVA